ncbi:MAG: hypothetical protein F4Z15_12065 [Gammaproteobacteria bacterium]|nr:hypothetical protein [Gammaproteobacteria bacterium]MYD76502.1 hypothetical protein [Gammaproteobacteria bacterium]
MSESIETAWETDAPHGDGNPQDMARTKEGGRMRIFQIGMQRCGTTSIALFLNRCGIPCIHYDEGRLAKRIRVNLAAGDRPLAGYDERYLAFANMNWNAADDYCDAFKEYAAFRRVYSGRYILNTRPMEHWIRSVMAHKALRGRHEAAAHWMLRFGTADPERVAEGLRAERDEHHRRVLAEIPADELLVFDIESGPPEKLCDFVGVGRECAQFWTRENATMNPLGRFLVRAVPDAVKRSIPERWKRPVKNRLAK